MVNIPTGTIAPTTVNVYQVIDVFKTQTTNLKTHGQNICMGQYRYTPVVIIMLVMLTITCIMDCLISYLGFVLHDSLLHT